MFLRLEHQKVLHQSTSEGSPSGITTTSSQEHQNLYSPPRTPEGVSSTSPIDSPPSSFIEEKYN